jgi:hypothetical protein
MTWPFIQGAVVFVGYRPSGLAAFAIAVTIISLATAARATGFLSGKQILRLASLTEASIELRQKVLEREISEQDREEARLKLLSRVLDMPVADCATEPATDGSVRSALDLLLSFEDRQASADLQ